MHPSIPPTSHPLLLTALEADHTQPPAPLPRSGMLVSSPTGRRAVAGSKAAHRGNSCRSQPLLIPSPPGWGANELPICTHTDPSVPHRPTGSPLDSHTPECLFLRPTGARLLPAVRPRFAAAAAGKRPHGPLAPRMGGERVSAAGRAPLPPGSAAVHRNCPRSIHGPGKVGRPVSCGA